MFIDHSHELILRAQGQASRERRIVSASQAFGTGAAGCPSGECDLDVPESYSLDHLDCYFDTDGQSTTVAGQAAATVTFDPQNPYIQPVAVSVTVVDSTDPQLDQRVWITAVSVKGCQQEQIHETAPTAATTRIIPSDKYDPRNRNGCACPICWDLYSNAANTRLLQIAVFNPNPAGTTARVIINTYGRTCGGIPADCKGLGKPPFKRVPRVGLSGRFPNGSGVPVG